MGLLNILGENMTKLKKSAVLGMAFYALAGLLAAEALACIRCGAANPGKGCRQLVTVKHPDLKGPARKKEWSKCMADPDKYGK
jgi:hypothetical protein